MSENLTDLRSQLAEAEKERDEAIEERDGWRREVLVVSKQLEEGWMAKAVAAEARLATLTAALEAVQAQQPETLAMIERNGFVFDSIGREPGNWQHLAFSIYTDLCQVETIASTALAALREATKPDWSYADGK